MKFPATNFRAARVLFCVGIVACAGSEPTAPSTESLGIAGTWTLRSIGRFNFSQQQLPYTDGDEVFIAAVITANGDGTFSEETTRRVTTNGQATTTTRVRSGTWTQVDSGLYRLRNSDMPAEDYIVTEVSGTNMKFHNIPNTWVFTRDVPVAQLPNQAQGQPFRGCALVRTVSRSSTVQGSLDDGDCRLAESGFYAEFKVDYYELRLSSPATFAIEEVSTDFDSDWIVFDRATGADLWYVSVKDVPERAWRRITLGAGTYIVAATSQFGGDAGSYALTVD